MTSQSNQVHFGGRANHSSSSTEFYHYYYHLFAQSKNKKTLAGRQTVTSRSIDQNL